MISKHLWHVVMDKNFLWVKWISTVKLKCKSVWAVNEDNNDSWSWRNILRLRNEVNDFMVMQVGNGRKASMWFDNWSSIGAMHKFISYRDLYNARLNVETKVADMLEDGI